MVPKDNSTSGESRVGGKEMMKMKDLANKVIGDSLHRARKKGSFHLPPKSLPIDKLKPYTTFTR